MDKKKDVKHTTFNKFIEKKFKFLLLFLKNEKIKITKNVKKNIVYAT
tara:strand:+ start:3948 stop:4088 length:141 start_codon:yes stop_codon:yes gene_type:complete